MPPPDQNRLICASPKSLVNRYGEYVHGNSDPEHRDSPPTSPGGNHRFGPGGNVFSYGQILTMVRREAKQYMNSKPGIDSKAKKCALHSDLHGILERNEAPPLEELVDLRLQIDYRMNQIMGAANTLQEIPQHLISSLQRGGYRWPSDNGLSRVHPQLRPSHPLPPL